MVLRYINDSWVENVCHEKIVVQNVIYFDLV